MITLIAGGVGAARLLRGLVRAVPAKDLTVIVNTGDDDEFYGLHVSPDIDTILYTLAGIAPIERGWGIEDDTFSVRAELDRLCGPGWFALGDRDLATHIRRTHRLAEGASLSEVTSELAAARGIRVRVLPMSDDPVRTIITTKTGDLAFQEYLVRRRARPQVLRVRYRGARTSRPARGVLEAISRSRLVILAPSNPFVSLGPILAVPGIRAALAVVRAGAGHVALGAGGRGQDQGHAPCLASRAADGPPGEGGAGEVAGAALEPAPVRRLRHPDGPADRQLVHRSDLPGRRVHARRLARRYTARRHAARCDGLRA